METNPASVQPYPAQSIDSPIIQTPQHLCNPDRINRITDQLRELLDPAYILLFGTYAAGTPHSQTNALDLMAITQGNPHYDWYDAKRFLKMKSPKIEHRGTLLNVYVFSKHIVEANFTPFIYLARKEGIVLYRSHEQNFSRPRNAFDFGNAAAEAHKYAQTFLPLADRMIQDPAKIQDPATDRMTALATAQAAIYYFRTLYRVYHGFDIESDDLHLLQHRMRTLSGELPLIFESGEFNPIHTLRSLNEYMRNARYDPYFFVRSEELAEHRERVRRLGVVVHKLCDARIELYRSRSE